MISKSGGTAETMSQYLIIRERLQAELGDGYRRHLLFTTDPEKGVLRALATEEDVATLPVPPNVGGRFSVLSAVGLLPAAMVGIDIGELLAGAREMVERCETAELRSNPAGIFAALQYLADTELDAPIHVMMPYSDRLRDVADWFRQLWAESLGKQRTRGGDEVFAGPTPVKSLGATDQHSQVQLYVEGPFDKTITFLAEREGADGRADPLRLSAARGAGVPGRPQHGRAAAHGDAGHGGGAGAARADEHDHRGAAGGRALPGRTDDAAADRHGVRGPLLRHRPAWTSRGWSWASSSPTASWAAPASTRPGQSGKAARPRTTRSW